jgi:putative FmdB family regulatory protein
MPLYEYRCTKCGDRFEILQKFSDRPKRRCSKCSGKLEKLISRTSFQLKGGGWFDQGYGSSSGGRGSGGNGSGSGASSSGGSTSGKSSSGSDTKSSAATA